MAEIATYTCSNKACLLTVMLSKQFPIWHPHTPSNLKTLSKNSEAEKFITGYHSDSFCGRCRRVKEISEEGSCTHCGEKGLNVEHAGRTCPRCTDGIFLMTALSVY